MSSWTSGRGARAAVVLLLVAAALGLGCRQDMHNQPSYSPLEPSSFFEDGTSALTPPEGTVPRGMLREDAPLYTGRKSASSREFVAEFPFEITSEMLDRGQEQYNVFCSVCHDRVGYGNGMVVQRGFRRAQSFHSDRLREVEVGYLFDVITNGFGAMPDYASQIEVEDRWYIVAYVRALQLSQHATPDDVPAAQRAALGSP